MPPLHKYWGRHVRLSHRDRRPWLSGSMRLTAASKLIANTLISHICHTGRIRGHLSTQPVTTVHLD